MAPPATQPHGWPLVSSIWPRVPPAPLLVRFTCRLEAAPKLTVGTVCVCVCLYVGFSCNPATFNNSCSLHPEIWTV